METSEYTQQVDRVATPPAPRPRNRRARSHGVPWLFLVPGLAVFLFVLVIPSGRGIFYSFTNWNGLNATFDLVGFDNYRRLWGDSDARSALIRSLQFAGAITVLQTAFGLALALGVNSAIRGRNFARVVFFAPVIVMPIVTAYLWRYILGSTGPLNQSLEALHAPDLQQPWLGDPALAFWSIVLVVVWQFSGVTMAIYLAGLQGISDGVLEAAALDGAGPVRRFIYVVFPLLRPATTVTVLLTLISSLKLFDQIWVMTAGGPGTSTDNLSTKIYKNVFNIGDFSYGITFAVALTVLVSVLAAAQYLTLQRERS